MMIVEAELDSLFLGLCAEFVGFVANLIPSASSVNGPLANIGAGTWYFLNVFMITQGLSMLVSAYATRFVIRRLPVIG